VLKIPAADSSSGAHPTSPVAPKTERVRRPSLAPPPEQLKDALSYDMFGKLELLQKQHKSMRVAAG
jgi:hypothetical protein